MVNSLVVVNGYFLEKKKQNISCFSALLNLMLQAAVFPLCVFSDDYNVNVLVASLDSREGLAMHHVGVQVQTRADKERKIRTHNTIKLQ